jgi:hypothetical protein
MVVRGKQKVRILVGIKPDEFSSATRFRFIALGVLKLVDDYQRRDDGEQGLLFVVVGNVFSFSFP